MYLPGIVSASRKTCRFNVEVLPSIDMPYYGQNWREMEDQDALKPGLQMTRVMTAETP